MSHGPKPPFHASDLFRAMRPAQWAKNAVVLAALFFAIGDPGQALDAYSSTLLACTAMLLFCLTSSGGYLLNDIVDREADRHHPFKKDRPIAAGRVTVGRAWFACALLLASGLGGATLLSILVDRPFVAVLALYVILQAAYTVWLKRIALIDIMVIASGFVLRAMAGAVVLGVAISPWLLLCTFFLALFLALCKRRHEKVLLEDGENRQRTSLGSYDKQLLDQLISIVSATTIVSYSIYTLSPGTVLKFGSARLGFTIPFVLFGIFRYLDLVYRHNKGDRPEKILLSDVPLIVDLVLYAITAAIVFAWR